MSGAILMFVGAGSVTYVDLRTSSAYGSATTPDDATAVYSVNSNGTVTGSGFTSYTWLLIGNASDYEIRATETSGTVTVGTVGTWLSLGTSRTWEKTRTLNGAGTAEVTLSVQIRRASDLEVLDTTTVTLTAEVLA